MPLHVRRGEIDRDNNFVGEPQTIASFDDRAAAESFIEGEIARFDHNGFVPDGHQAGWWGRNDRDPFEKIHFWIEGDAAAAAPEPVRDPQYRGIP
jgi:hypothetical protein